MQQSVIIEQILFLAVLVLIGVIASRIGVIREKERDGLVKIIFNITLPLLLFTNFSKLEMTPEILRNSYLLIIISLVVIVLMLLLAWLSSLFFRMNHAQLSVFIPHNAFGNVLYFGFPVVNALFGELGLFYASIYAFVSIMLLWTVGIYVITRKGGTSFRRSMKNMLNPNSVAILAGFILFLLKVKIPGFLLKPFVSLGDTTIYLSMLYIGALLGLMKVRGVFSNKYVYLTSINKTLLFPFIFILGFAALNNYTGIVIDPLIVSVVIVEAAMPCMANIVIIAKMYRVDDQLATANVFISTLMSIVTLPFIYWLMSQFL
ncbi:MAG: AEC family transporter [Bacteroidales bacterium]|jgi:predicted permease|nr:AEC family transporter [Bacteroidales bacterium]